MASREHQASRARSIAAARPTSKSWATARARAADRIFYGGLMRQVREAPSRPGSRAGLSRLQLCSHGNAWDNLHLLGQPDTLLAARASRARPQIEHVYI